MVVVALFKVQCGKAKNPGRIARIRIKKTVRYKKHGHNRCLSFDPILLASPNAYEYNKTDLSAALWLNSSLPSYIDLPRSFAIISFNPLVSIGIPTAGTNNAERSWHQH